MKTKILQIIHRQYTVIQQSHAAAEWLQSTLQHPLSLKLSKNARKIFTGYSERVTIKIKGGKKW